MWNAAIRAIIDLLKLRKDVRKTDLEIKKLEREDKASANLIQRATTEEVIKFDPKTNANFRAAREQAKQYQQGDDSRPPSSHPLSTGCGIVVAAALILVAIVYGIYRLVR